MKVGSPLLVTLSEIAEYAQVRRPSVSNWRRRHTDFPRPVSASSNVPLFDSDEVAAWLDRRPVHKAASPVHTTEDEENSPATYGEVYRTGILLSAVTSHRELPPEELLIAALRVVCAYRSASEATPVTVQEFPPDPDLHASVHALVDVLGRAAATERLMDLASRLELSWAPEQAPPAVCTLVSRLHQVLADGAGDASIVDLSAGAGAGLLALLSTGAPRSATAVVNEVSLGEILSLRLRAHGIPAVDIQVSAPITHDSDVVLAYPPFVPGERADHADHPLLWAEQAVSMLQTDGLAYVVVPDWTLTHTGRGSSTPPVAASRERLLRNRCIRAVVQLPRRIHPSRPGAELVLLVLTPRGEGGSTVTLCDADRIARTQGRHTSARTNGQGWIAPWAEETVLSIAEAHRRPGSEVCRSFTPADLMDRHRVLPLLPSQRLTPSSQPQEHITEAGESRRDATVALAGTSGPTLDWLNRLRTPPRRTPTRYERLGSLLTGGQLRLVQGHRIRTDDLGDEGQTVYGREEMLGEIPVGQRRISPLVLAEYPSALVTEPGDVILLFDERLRTVVDQAGGSVLLFPVQALRIRAYGDLRKPMSMELGRASSVRIWPHQLAAVLSAGRNARRGRGSLVRRADLEGVEIPVMSPTEAKLFDDAMREHAAEVERLRRQLTAMEDLGAVLASGVADGALSVQLHPRARRPDSTNVPFEGTASDFDDDH
ncbi:hypothetical protein Ndas_3079 [Nocardiopsis dassonvillei subsp. dassonvillei DSM 43111]|uniref:DNA methylase adenine-specific domain-containing protein n=1 Tax=Nocardiopsis dassonvillei (strain ATCC 23218 / DSM 43111 / CIP 107115 / JCM 7437 / KCTC 9190 / NBRC 14626 / NCTC 10488 / NRRL B-5397 / IMRU 509) TaxID=446468 RepID=D7B1R2_NOCDD|nr:hypothetical protein Ndas_3079 [Nocardiopsis dassonvillei subsp. dassonvillei DSM 43111]